ncbi:hypothetical protein O6H91_10G080400 [Diphasiastrum complanatum]|uniref:Uncharacterized protein n=1 Tax=Diphasiastrum complanatum TaxID=34168 RepID=A0ACC2CIW2_DIPCM|nr:hypothetical protein O6H91_10G080400 [Diphasiastrum complanatum]
MACCRGEGSCCPNGCFAHAFVLCFGLGFARSEDVCECTIPCFHYISAPGVESQQILCCTSTTTFSPAKTVATNSACFCNLCCCGFDFGNYAVESRPRPLTTTTITTPPIPVKICESPAAVPAEKPEHLQIDHQNTGDAI